MHLWPSATIRDSFKLDYLRKLEWNLERMKREKKSSNSVNQKLLNAQQQQQEGEVNGKATEVPNSNAHGGVVLGLFRYTLVLLSSCFCGFWCGDEEVDPLF